MINNNAHRRIAIVTVVTLFLSLLGGGTLLFRWLEGWTWAQSFYFTVTTITTVGYGDLTPSSDATRIVTAIFILIGVGIAAGIISYYGNAVIKHRVQKNIRDRGE